MLTSKQVLDGTGFNSVRTLQRWRKRNLVPPPTLQRHPNGHGMTWMWPVWTILHIEVIKKRLAEGESLDDIARTLSGDWQAEEKKWIRKRYDFKAACERMARDDATDQYAEHISDAVYAYLRDIGVERPGRIDERVERAVSAPRFREEVLKLIREGFSPVMLLMKKGDVKVIPDFLLGSAFGKSDNSGQPVLVVPIRDAVLAAFATVDPNLPQDPTFVPAMQVVEHCEKAPRSPLPSKR